MLFKYKIVKRVVKGSEVALGPRAGIVGWRSGV